MIERLLLTGAGGRLGSYLREPLSKLCTELVSTDIKSQIGCLYKNEKFVSADLANLTSASSYRRCHYDMSFWSSGR